MRHRHNIRQRAGRIQANIPVGIILLAVGGVLLARQMGVDFPNWLFRWEMLLVTIGLLVGAKSGFRDSGWLIITGAGLFFMADDFFPHLKPFFWPALIILIGLIVILRPARQKKTLIIPDTAGEPTDINTENQHTAMKGDILDVASVFGGTKKLVLSKNFKGGEIVSVFGAADINLSQADFTSPVKIEIVAIFGGAKLIVPANWEIRSETVVIMGGIDDKREPVPMANPEKILILEGTVMFGGIEISSY
jgi:predicted membrane protein